MKHAVRITAVCILLGAIAGAFYWPVLYSWFDSSRQTIRSAGNYVRQYYDLPLIGTPDLARLKERLAHKKLKLGDPIFMRIFKKESQLELWIRNGKSYKLFDTYPICYWSGFLGPKLKQGDKQAPEGFYTVSRSQLNPNSRFHRSFNLGYPNKFDKAHKRTGDYLMVHGNCVSAGCYAMTDPVITELWKFVTAALSNGQKRFHVHAYPFRMTEINLMLHNNNRWNRFWWELKQGYDLFEKNKIPPKVQVCNKRYSVKPGHPKTSDSALVRTGCT